MVEFSDVRVSDAERESALSALGEHMGTGRLGLSEFDDRSAQVAAAVTRRDLAALFDDLPQPHPTFDSTAPVPAPAPEPQAAVRERRPNGTRVITRVAAPILGIAVVVLVVAHLWLLIAIPVLLGVAGAALVRGSRDPRRSGWNDGDLDGDDDAYYDGDRYGWYGRGYTRNYTRSYMRRYRRGPRSDRDDY
ncbi:DUF1707 domain-containing protein [Kutzneria buriramensis]|uniref:Uncharacterized protein DUF1707 n=1 Tax=Kutzneria buriramensis TaxID=1045776 RepID=A0A3E0HKP6_9PSEU|nr:DUF1707 domain-containing protein [Kutzneria buriramensis]REH46938.1 uncharacterized protein DUF1707 [Kutzneria buriramensis]